MFYHCYTRTENEGSAADFFTRAAVALYGAMPENHNGGNSWDAMSGQRGLAQALRWTEQGEGVPKALIVDHLSDLGKDVPGLVKQIAALRNNDISIHAMATDLWFRSGDVATEVIRALAAAHIHYTKNNRRAGIANAKAAGATIGRPLSFTLSKTRHIIEEMINENHGKPPSVRQLAKRAGCGSTKASQLLQEWKSETSEQ